MSTLLFAAHPQAKPTGPCEEQTMDNVYVLRLIDHNDDIVVGVFAAEGLAEMAREKLEADMTEDQQDAGVFYRITAYELGKIYT